MLIAKAWAGIGRGGGARPKNSFILTIEATKIVFEPPPLEIEKGLGSPPLEKFLPTPLAD